MNNPEFFKSKPGIPIVSAETIQAVKSQDSTKNSGESSCKRQKAV